MNRWTDLDTPHGCIHAWRSEPAGPSRGAIVVLQEIFGVNAHIRDVTDRFAQAGFVALAPALFDPVERDVELEYDASGIARGLALTRALGIDRAVDLANASASLLQAEGLRTGAVGFCWGGTIALLANTRLGLPSVSYYGGRNVQFLDEPLRAPMMFHFGSQDRSISAADVEQHREKYPAATVHVYPAGHGFNCEPRADYDAASAAQAWQRSIDFFEENLR
ncbi:dienelactone hydrolase family protein [Lysobacter sp. A03]|uniref:dienelactone hydrolase family protein n=1 Tax=Lysobacter sp. A03 TaxID=1199154 RepID=UPI0005B6C9FE|nr:dienelactone hydrolase family protein [Lysobacter sp. A03]KIQ98370.1 Dienelactone hydrolase family [Lysobacter sp. A03]